MQRRRSKSVENYNNYVAATNNDRTHHFRTLLNWRRCNTNGQTRKHDDEAADGVVENRLTFTRDEIKRIQISWNEKTARHFGLSFLRTLIEHEPSLASAFSPKDVGRRTNEKIDNVKMQVVAVRIEALLDSVIQSLDKAPKVEYFCF